MSLIKSFRKRPQASLSTRDLLKIQTRVERETGIRSVHDIRISKDLYIYHGVWPASASDDVERDVFIKILFSQDPDKTERFERESWLYSHFRHDHLIRKEFSRSLSLGKPFGRAKMIVLEYLDGLDAAQLLDYLMLTGTAMEAGLALEIGIKVLKALREVHDMTGRDGKKLLIVHSDVSPHNILLSRNGQVKLIDFGVARTAIDGTSALPRCGKPGYASPEQILTENHDHRSDLFSLGVVLAELVMSKRLAGAQHAKSERISDQLHHYGSQISESGLNQSLSAILIKAICQNPEQRYQTAAEFSRALEDYVQEQNVFPRTHALADLVEDVLRFYRSQMTIQTTGLLDKETAQGEKISEPPVSRPKKRNKRLSWAPFAFGILIPMILIGAWKFSPSSKLGESQMAVEKIAVVQENKIPIQEDSKKIEVKDAALEIKSVPELELEQWTGQISLESPGASIAITDGSKQWRENGKLVLSSLPVIEESQNFTATITRSGYKSETLNFTLTRTQHEFSKTIALEALRFGSLFVGASPWAEVSVPGYASQKPVPFSLRLAEGWHKVTARYQDEKGKWQYLSKSVMIAPDSKIKCLAYFEEEKRLICK